MVFTPAIGYFIIRGEAAWQKTKDKALALLDKNPSGTKKGDVSRKRFTRSAQEAHDI